jgi:hypothetical protein
MTNEEKRKIYLQLAAPFPEHCIQRTEGRLTGRGYDTTGIGYQHIANRLNEVLGVGGWRAHRTVTVKEIVRSNGRPAFEAICDITLELGEWIDGKFIVFAESRADGGHLARQDGWTRGHAERGLLPSKGQPLRQQSHSGRQVQPWKTYDSSVWMSTRIASPSR